MDRFAGKQRARGMGATVIAVGMVTRDDVEAAAARTRHVVRHTPLTLVEPGVFPGTVMLKLEQLQHTGSYAVRGVFNHVIHALERQTFDPDAGLAAAYTPSIASAVVHAARRLGIPATLFLPVGASVDAEVLDDSCGPLPEGTPAGEIMLVRVDGSVADARIEAQRHATTSGALHCAGLGAEGWPEMVAGAGTVGLELWTQTLGQLDTVVVPDRARALAAGVAAALAGHVRVVEADGGRVD
ncbi:MAG: pyridoxal-phosphate dependent enzyme, partial [Hamadaea sp.]|nr:pyridoxal-phosphate dependent enzyme [Hamadaea sp.]